MTPSHIPSWFEAMSDVREPLPCGKSIATEAVLEQLVADRLLPMNISLERAASVAGGRVAEVQGDSLLLVGLVPVRAGQCRGH